MRVTSAIGACALCIVAASPALAQDMQLASLAQDDLADLSIEELAQIQVRSASKRDEPLSAAAAALYVITGEEIESNGITSLPEALRLAPNLSVQQVDASQYSISARGFNGIQAGNKVLAMIDGRSIYTPLGSTVFWNQWWPLLEDIQQIEVISGPGGTLYGPNAVNGVINVTTKDAQETLGTLVRGTAGPLEGTAAIRHGFTLGDSGAVRVYANWHDAEGLPTGIGDPARDAYRGWQAGFRSDFVTDSDHFTLQGDIFRNNAETLPGDGARGHNVLARWSRTLSPTSSFQLQTYYDWFKRDVLLVDDSVSTMDAEGQFNATAGRHVIVAGAGVRTTRDRFVNELNFFQLNPSSRRLWVYNAFLQDHFRMTDQLALTLGVKVERSTFTGWQVLPNARLSWQPNDRNLLWASVSRAVRTPSRIDRQLEAPPFLAAAPDFDSEKLIAVEAGYRGQPSDTTSLSVNAFVNFYDDLRTTELFFNDGDPFFQLGNGYKGKTYGIESWGSAQMTPWWRLQLGFSTLWKDIHEKGDHVDFAPRNSLGNDPSWRIVARSDFELAPRVQLSVNGRAVGEIEQDPEIGSYVEAGGQLAYQLDEDVELFVAGRNLIHRTHVESNDPQAGQLAKRSIYAGARARF
jgi:iron complex outermembrane recepter protein